MATSKAKPAADASDIQTNGAAGALAGGSTTEDERPLRSYIAPRKKAPKKPSPFWRFREEVPFRLKWTLLVISSIAPIAAWIILYQTHTVNEIFLPSPWDVIDSGQRLISNGSLWDDAAASLRRVAIGFGISILISIPLGLAMGSFRSIQHLFEPMIGFVRYMPATAFVPLLLIWLGLDEAPKIALIFIGTVFFNTIMVANLVWSVPTELVKVSYTLGASTRTVFAKVIFPHAVPGMFDTARVNLAAAWNLIIVAELLAATEGLGFRIVRAQRFLNIDQIFFVLIVIGIIGVTFDISLRVMRNKVAPWSQE